VTTAASDLAERLDRLLPQTQCTRCGYADCRAYADAIAVGTADINRCPPGGETTLLALAALAGRAPQPLDATCGQFGALTVAVIDESACIGCKLCIDACPVDAIIGAPKRMHAILPSLCSGCELCVAPCPVDCIAMVPAAREWTDADAVLARDRLPRPPCAPRACRTDCAPPRGRSGPRAAAGRRSPPRWCVPAPGAAPARDDQGGSRARGRRRNHARDGQAIFRRASTRCGTSAIPPPAKRASLPSARTTSPSSREALEIDTQIARALGLQRRFDAAHATLDAVSPGLAAVDPRVRVRYLLERGRAYNSSGAPTRRSRCSARLRRAERPPAAPTTSITSSMRCTCSASLHRPPNGFRST
jgi:electron transport complex protein RnfB